MNCDCLICRKNKAGLVSNLVTEGKSFKQILLELQKHNRINIGVLEKHFRLNGYSHLIPIKELPTVGVVGQSNQINSFDFNSINFDDYSFDETNPETVIEYFQKALLFMYGRQLQIVASEQAKKYLGDEDISGLAELHKLEKIEGMLHKIYPIHIYANQRVALDVVSRMGYKLTLGTEDVIQTSTDS